MLRTISCNECGETAVETWELVQTERADEEVSA